MQEKITQDEFEDYLRRMQASADAIPDIAEATSNGIIKIEMI